MCEEPTTMYIPSDDVDGIGLHSCGVCGFEIEGPRDEPAHVADHRKLTATTTSTTCRFPLEVAEDAGIPRQLAAVRVQDSTRNGRFLQRQASDREGQLMAW
jgi:hypothetical protein